MTKMSVYGGFGTRLQETAYNQLLESLLRLLQDCILSNIEQKKLKTAWSRRFLEIFYELTRLESSKYLPPKLSLAVKDLAHSLSPRPKRFILPDISAPVYERNQSFSARSLTPSPAPFLQKSKTPTQSKSSPRALSLKHRPKRYNGIRGKQRRLEGLPREELEWMPARDLSQQYYSHIMLNRLRFHKANPPILPNS